MVKLSLWSKNFLKSGQVISGHSVYQTLFPARTDLFSHFFSLISEHYKQLRINFSDKKREI